MSEWIQTTTAELLKTKILTIGDGYRAKNSELVDDGIPFARAGNINNGFLFSSADHLPNEYVDVVGEKLSKAGDTVFTSKGTVGRFGFVRDTTPTFVYSPQLCFWRSLQYEKLLPRFIYYWMHGKEFLEQVEGVKGQTDMADYVNLADQRKMRITLPDIEEQKSIAIVLSSLDDKIDLLHRQNKTLESMAETLFRQWFAEGENESCSISDLIEFNPTRKLTKGTMAPYLEMAALSTTTFNPESWYNREFSSGTKFINGDTLLARITPCLENGKTAYVTFLQEGKVAWGSTEYIVMRPKEGLHPFFAYALARNSDFRDYAEGCMEGSSGRQRINVDHLKDYELAIPSKEAIQQFNDCAASITPKLHANFVQLKTLEKLRDCLLPKLMNGELKIN